MNDLLGPLVLFAAAVTLTPGPNVVLVTASAANFGFRRTVPQMLGITFGFGLWFGLAGCIAAVVVASGAGRILRRPEDYYDR